MATIGALKRRAEELRQGINAGRAEIANFARGNEVYQGGSPNPSGTNGEYTPYYDAEYALTESDILGQKARAQSGARTASSRLESQYRTGISAVDRLREQALKTNTVSMADQGILRSGINIGQQGEIGRDYLEAVRELTSQKAMSQEDVENELAQQESDLSSNLMNAQLLRMQRETEYRLQQALRESELAADQEALAATQREIEKAKEEEKLKAQANGKFIPKGSTKKPTTKKPAAKKKTPAQLKRQIAKLKARNKTARANIKKKKKKK